MAKHRLKSSNIQKDTTIRLRFDGGAWATMSFQHFEENDWWQVSINSDWGTWQYSWSRSGMGKDIFNFMACRAKERSYLVNKFIGNEEKLFDGKKSAQAIRKDIRESIKYWDDRERFEELIQITKEMEHHENHDHWLSDAFREDELIEALGHSEMWHYLRFERHPRTKYFFKNIFPKFFKDIKRIANEQ